MNARIVTQGDSAPPYVVQASPGFAAWLHATGSALAVSTYQIGKLFLIGAPEPDRLSVPERTFPRCLGVVSSGTSLYLAGAHNILRFENVVPPGQQLEGHDAVFVPRVSWYTGDVFAHDLGVLPSGRPVFVNTLFSCLATVDEKHSFRSVWQPPFVSALRPEDRCHLNGLAMRDGLPRYVTVAGTGDANRAWRENRVGNGCAIDMPVTRSWRAGCMIQVIDPARGEAAHWLALGGVVRELYDIACVEGAQTPMKVGMGRGPIDRLINRGPSLDLDTLTRVRP